MKVKKLFEGMEQLFFGNGLDEKKQEKLKTKLYKKMEQTKKEIKNSTNDEEINNLKAKLDILKKLLQRVE